MSNPERASSRRKRLWFWVAVVLAILVAIGFIAERIIAAQAGPDALTERINNELTRSSRGLYRVSIGGSSLDLLGGSYVATDIQLHLDSARLKELRGEKGAPRDLYTLQIPRLEVSGLSRAALLRRSLDAERMTIFAPIMTISLDRQIAKAEGGSPPLPHQALQQLGTAVSIGRLDVDGGNLTYRERAGDGARYGRFEFADVDLAIDNVTNRRVGDDTLATINLAFAPGGQGRVEATIEYHLFSPNLTMNYHGGGSGFDPTTFNSMTVDLEGVRITDAQLDTLWFRIAVEDDLATGRLLARYRDLRIETLDKVTRDQSLGDHLAAFISNNFKLRVDNPKPDEPVKTAFIRVKRSEKTPFLKFLWITLRSGVGETIGI